MSFYAEALVTSLSCLFRYLCVYWGSKIIERESVDRTGDWWAGSKMVTAVKPVSALMVFCNHSLDFLTEPLQGLVNFVAPWYHLNAYVFIEVACLLCRAADHSVDLPALFVFPSWRMHTPTVLPVPTSLKELLSNINTALLYPVVIKALSQIWILWVSLWLLNFRVTRYKRFPNKKDPWLNELNIYPSRVG